MTYVCTQCRESKPREGFGNHSRLPGGRNTICRACAAERQRAYRQSERGREFARAAARRYYRRHTAPGIARERAAAA